MLTRRRLRTFDREDPLAPARERFALPDGLIYLDGNSLGPASKAMAGRVRDVVAAEWGEDLIRAWNRRGWFHLPERVGARIAPLLGLAPDEVVATDSVSLNLFKLLGSLLRVAPQRRVVLAERSNFPTDLYIAQGLVGMLRDLTPEGAPELRLVEAEEFVGALGPDVAVATLTQVDFRTGRMRDLRRVTRAARAHRAPVVWDLSHSAGAFALDLRAAGVEFAVGCGYKYLNGGPGAPGFLAVVRERQDELQPVLAGWMGHAAPFRFETAYRPAPGMRRFVTGTPPVLSMAALEEGLRVFDDVDLGALRAKGEALGDAFIRLVDERLAGLPVSVASPRNAAERGSQVSLRVSLPEGGGFAVMQALIARGVIGDFRAPDLLRFGFAPLSVRYADLWGAVEALREVLTSGAFREKRYRQRAEVT